MKPKLVPKDEGKVEVIYFKVVKTTKKINEI